MVQLEKEDLQRIIEETKERLEEQEEGEEEVDEEENSENVEIDPKPENDLAAEKEAAVAMAAKAKTNVKKSGKHESQDDDFDTRYNMDDYDAEENDLSNPLKGIGNLTVHASNNDDPYITLKDEDDSDAEDFEIKPTDNLLLVGRAEQDFCNIEVHVYNAELSNLYVHHDILLPSFPLAVEWLDYDVTEEKPGNLVAIGTMEPMIDIWDLDLVDTLEPIATLGQRPKKKKKKSNMLGHTDAVLGLSWNSNARHVLASASADSTVGLWDLSQGTMAMSIKQHKDKVQCVKWHPVEEHMLLSGSFDKSVKMYDCRSPDTNHKSWDLGGEVEQVIWNHFSPINFFASTDKGNVYYMDSRQDEPIYTLSAHNKDITGLSLSSENSNLLVTTSSDHIVKVWDIKDNKPSLVLSRDIKLGQLHCLGSCPDAPYAFAFGGDKDVKVWDIRESADVFNHFCSEDGPKSNDEQEDDAEEPVSMDMQDSGLAMEIDAIASSSSQQSSKNKKKKKKKKNKKNF